MHVCLCFCSDESAQEVAIKFSDGQPVQLEDGSTAYIDCDDAVAYDVLFHSSFSASPLSASPLSASPLAASPLATSPLAVSPLTGLAVGYMTLSLYDLQRALSQSYWRMVQLRTSAMTHRVLYLTTVWKAAALAWTACLLSETQRSVTRLTTNPAILSNQCSQYPSECRELQGCENLGSSLSCS